MKDTCKYLLYNGGYMAITCNGDIYDMCGDNKKAAISFLRFCGVKVPRKAILSNYDGYIKYHELRKAGIL